MEQELAVAFRTENGRLDDFNLETSQLPDHFGDFVHRRLLSLRVAHDPTLANLLPPNFKLRLDQHYSLETRG